METFDTRALEFLLFQGIVYIFFFIFNIIIMKIKGDICFKGLCQDDNCILVDAFYYTTATHTSIGFGDITPKEKWVRVSASLHMLFVFVLIILEI